MFPRLAREFDKLAKEGKTVVYKESKEEINEDGWEFWSIRDSESEEVFVYRKIVTFEEAEQFYLEQEYN